MIEYSRGTNPTNPPPFHEAYAYALDGLPMFLAIFILNIMHPGRVLVGPGSEFPKLSRKEKKLLKAQNKAAKAEKKAAKKGKGSTPKDEHGNGWENLQESGVELGERRAV